MSTSKSNIKSLLPIDWQAVTELGKEINLLQGNPYSSNDLGTIEMPNHPEELILMVASVVANSRDPRFKKKLPSEDDLKRLKPWIASIQGLIRKVSPMWAGRFGGYVEQAGQSAVAQAANLIIQSAEWCRGFKEPRNQFVGQMEKLYRLILQRVSIAGFWENRDARIEEKVGWMLQSLRPGSSNALPGFNEKAFPFLFAMARKFNFPDPCFSTKEAGIAGAEFLASIHEFLTNQGVRNLPLPPRASEFDLFDSGTWKRGLAEAFYSEKLDLVRSRLPKILDLVVRALPESGPELADAIYGITIRMCELDESGMSPEEICKLLFK